MKIDEAETVLNEFFKRDNSLTPSGKRKRSILLAAKDDLGFCRALYKRIKPLNLSKEQLETFISLLPSFAAILIYCSAIDLLARVVTKTRPGHNENGKFFKTSAKEFFGQSEEVAEQLWKLRNSVSHNYSIEKIHGIYPHGSSSVAEKDSNGNWRFFLNAMYSNLMNAIDSMYNEVKTLSNEEKISIAKYISNNGFIYTN